MQRLSNFSQLRVIRGTEENTSELLHVSSSRDVGFCVRSLFFFKLFFFPHLSQAAAAAPAAGYPSNLLAASHMDPAMYHLMQQSGMHGQVCAL